METSQASVSYLRVILRLHRTFNPEQFLHRILVAVRHFEIGPLVPEILSDSRVAQLTAVDVKLSRAIDFAQFAL